MSNKQENWLHPCYETKREAEEAFETYVDEMYPLVKMFGMNFYPSDILLGHVAEYQLLFADWLDQEEGRYNESQKETR
jgi:hypothetical protein